MSRTVAVRRPICRARIVSRAATGLYSSSLFCRARIAQNGWLDAAS